MPRKPIADLEDTVKSFVKDVDDLRENPTVAKRAAFEASRMVGLEGLPSLDVLVHFFRIPHSTIAKDLGLTKGRLSQLMSSDSPLSLDRRFQLNDLAREAVNVWLSIAYTRPVGLRKDTIARATFEIIGATAHAAQRGLNKDLTELGEEAKKAGYDMGASKW